MRINLTEGQYVDLLELDGDFFLNTELPSGEKCVSMPENEEVYPNITECEAEEEITIEVDDKFYLVDNYGHSCPKILGGRPRKIVKRK